MSGLFQRIARRRSDDSGEPSAHPPAGDSPASAPGAQPPAPDAAEQPTRFIGLPADAVTPAEQAPSAPPDERPGGPDVPSAAAPPGAETQPPAAAPLQDQPTALFPLVPDQPTEAHPALPADAAPLSAGDTGSMPVSAGSPAATPATSQPGSAAAPGQPQPAAPTGEAEQQAAVQPPEERRPGFRERGRMRRRLRYLRRLRELQVRDLGGLAFDLRRFERKRDDLVAQKIDQIRACDDELRALETALEERRDVRDLRMPGIGGTCPRCFSLYGSNDRFCSHCGAALGGLAQGPAQVAAPPPPATPPAGSPSTPTAPPPPQ